MALTPSQVQEIISNSERPPIYRIKITTAGSSRCGKSCLIRRYCEERFIKDYLPTVGVDYGVRPVEIQGSTINAQSSLSKTTLDVRANFFDLGGGDEFTEIRSEFYAGTQGMLFIYDLSQPATLTAILKFYDEYTKNINRTAVTKGSSSTDYPKVEYGAESTKIYLIGTKSDLPIKVLADEIAYVAKKIKAEKTYTCSAQTGEGVSEMFDEVFRNITRDCFIW